MVFKICLGFVLIASTYAVQVTLKQGALKGSQDQLVTGDGTYYAFKGIPYAATPNGMLRFKAPQPAPTWSGVRDATSYGAVCPQSSVLDPTVREGSEDCLFINVFTQNLTPKEPLPVMVFIYGGGFNTGSGNSDLYGPDFLVRFGVVLVTFNYRLGPLGFLNLNTTDVPGNAGLKDQVAALKWVKANIKKFGGNPDQVTIFGESSGGEAVSLHMLSPMSKGLFKRAIGMSGTVLNNWALPKESVKRAYRLGQEMGISTNDPKEMLTYLQSLPADSFIGVVPTVFEAESIISSAAVKQTYDTYVVEHNFGGEHFLTQDPVAIMKSGVINEADFLIGYLKAESKVEAYLSLSSVLATYTKYPELLIPLRIFFDISPEKSVHLADIVKKHYFGDKLIGNDTVVQLITYLTDDTYKYDIQRYIRHLPNPGCHARYFYNFNMLSDRNIFGNQAAAALGIKDAGHSDDVFYLFDPKLFSLPITTNSTEYSLIKKYCTLFTNFAKFGNPTPNSSTDSVLGSTEWLQYNLDTKAYLNIANELTSGNDLDADVVAFWDGFYKKAGYNLF